MSDFMKFSCVNKKRKITMKKPAKTVQNYMTEFAMLNFVVKKKFYHYK